MVTATLLTITIKPFFRLLYPFLLLYLSRISLYVFISKIFIDLIQLIATAEKDFLIKLRRLHKCAKKLLIIRPEWVTVTFQDAM
jgi:hypothetical protein